MSEYNAEPETGVPGSLETHWRAPDKSTSAPDGSGVVVVTGAAAGLGGAGRKRLPPRACAFREAYPTGPAPRAPPAATEVRQELQL